MVHSRRRLFHTVFVRNCDASLYTGLWRDLILCSASSRLIFDKFRADAKKESHMKIINQIRGGAYRFLPSPLLVAKNRDITSV